MTGSQDLSLKKTAGIAGLGLLVMTFFAVFANFYVFPLLIVPNDAVATSDTILAHEGLFRLGILSYVIVIVCDVIVAWALFVLFKRVHKSLSLLAAWFRLIYAGIFAVALNHYFGTLHLLKGAESLTGLAKDTMSAQVMLSLDKFNSGWDIGYVFFGLHLFFLGYLFIKSGCLLFAADSLRRVFGVLLIIASLGYLIDTFGKFLSSDYGANIALYTAAGEFVFMIWLLWRGAKGFPTQA